MLLIAELMRAEEQRREDHPRSLAPDGSAKNRAAGHRRLRGHHDHATEEEKSIRRP